MGAVTISLIQRFEILETRPWLQGLLIVAVITGPIALMVYFASTMMFPSSSETVTFLSYLPQVRLLRRKPYRNRPSRAEVD